MEQEEELTQCQITLCQTYFFGGSVPVMFVFSTNLCLSNKSISVGPGSRKGTLSLFEPLIHCCGS